MFFFLWADLADDFVVRHFMLPVMRYVVVGDGFECVGAFNMGFGWIRNVGANTLAKAAKFVSVRGVTGGFVFGVTSQLAMAK